MRATNNTVSVDALIDAIDRHAQLVTEGMPRDAVTKIVLEVHDQVKQVVNRMEPVGRAYATWKASEHGSFWFCSACGRVESDRSKYCRMCGAKMREDNNGSIQPVR